jgi:hypothetical protein
MSGGPRRLGLVGTVRRVRRFVPAAVRAIGHDTRFAARGAMRFEFGRAVVGDVRRAWLRSHPDWPQRLRALFEPSRERLARDEQDARERHQARERVAAVPVVYEGGVEAEGVFGSVMLTGLGDGGHDQDVSEWLCDVLGLDCWHGDRVRVRLTVELLLGPEPAIKPDSERKP